MTRGETGRDAVGRQTTEPWVNGDDLGGLQQIGVIPALGRTDAAPYSGIIGIGLSWTCAGALAVRRKALSMARSR